jgi:hypothetical protein
VEGEAHLVTECKVAPCLGLSNLFALLSFSPSEGPDSTLFDRAKPRTRASLLQSHAACGPNRTMHPAIDVPFTNVTSDFGRTGLCISFCKNLEVIQTWFNSFASPTRTCTLQTAGVDLGGSTGGAICARNGPPLSQVGEISVPAKAYPKGETFCLTITLLWLTVACLHIEKSFSADAQITPYRVVLHSMAVSTVLAHLVLHIARTCLFGTRVVATKTNGSESGLQRVQFRPVLSEGTNRQRGGS